MHQPPENDLRILVVDDNLDAAEILAMLIEDRGHQVRVARDGMDGLEKAREFLPHVVLSDIAMPLMDGYELARNLRTDPRFSETRLIALSGYGQEADRARTAEAGFNAHLTKPVGIAALEAVLAKPATSS